MRKGSISNKAVTSHLVTQFSALHCSASKYLDGSAATDDSNPSETSSSADQQQDCLERISHRATPAFHRRMTIWVLVEATFRRSPTHDPSDASRVFILDRQHEDTTT